MRQIIATIIAFPFELALELLLLILKLACTALFTTLSISLTPIAWVIFNYYGENRSMFNCFKKLHKELMMDIWK